MAAHQGPPRPSIDFLTDGYVALTARGLAFTLFNIYNQSADCRTINIHFCPAGSNFPGDNSYRIWRNGRWSRPLCYKPGRIGTVVPQTPWQPSQPGDVQRHVFSGLLWPIFFVRHGNVVGVNMEFVYRNGPPEDLDERDVLAPLGGVKTTTFCLRWPGYPEHKKQVEVQNTAGEITVGKLLERIARFITSFLEDVATHRHPGTDPSWRVGQGTGINANKICIVGLMHVSKGVWQPILQLEGLAFS